MAFGQDSSPTRFGQGQHATDERALYLDVFGGEVLSAFDLATVTMGRHEVKTLGGGAKSWRFPKTWKADAGYHRPGQELLGNDIATGETVITVDDILVSHKGITDLDTMLTHFDVRSKFSNEMGRSLARVFDKNVFRQLIKTARAPADGPFPSGEVISDAALAPVANVVDGAAWIEAIRDANKRLFNKDVPDDMERYLTVDADTFDAIKYATDANGNYLILSRDFGNQPAGGVSQRAQEIVVDGVTVIRSRNMPNTDESLDTNVYAKYRANYAATLGVLWSPMAVATVKIMDIGLESTRDTRRLEDFMVAKALVGHGTLRPECAIELTG